MLRQNNLAKKDVEYWKRPHREALGPPLLEESVNI